MSELSSRLADGEVLCGAGASTFSPTIVETYGTLGLEFVWLDLEHKGPSPADARALEDLVRAAETADIELLVRLPSAEPWLVRKVLDAGVSNVLLARIETASEVRRAVRATTLEYDDGTGRRGVGVSRASDWGTDGYEPTNDDPGVGVMVETEAAADDIADILEVPGLDFVYPGAGDLAVSVGRPLDTDDELVRETLGEVRAASRDAGLPLGRSVAAPEDISGAVDAGYQLLRFGDELDAVRRSLADFEDALRSTKAKE